MFKFIKIFFYFFILGYCSLQASNKDEFLPIEVIDNKNTNISIFYDDTNRIREVRKRFSANIDDGDSTITYYSYYSDGMLKEQIADTYNLMENDLIRCITRKEKYDYQFKDSSIISTTVKIVQIGNEIPQNDTVLDFEMFLNKEKLPYKIIHLDGFNNLITIRDEIEYKDNNQIVKFMSFIDSYSQEFYDNDSNEILASVPQKNIFSDVNTNKFKQIELEISWFYFFTDQAPTLIKETSSIFDINNSKTTKLSYQLDKNGYPIQINMIETENGKEPSESTLFVKYKKVSN